MISRTASPMITGPARFPVERNRKRMETEDTRRTEFLDWRERARRAVQAAVLDARTPEARHDAEWLALERDIAHSLSVIESIDTGREHWNRSAFVNSIVGKVDRLASSGQVELVEKVVATVQAYNEQHAKPAITARHTFWTFPEAARAAREQLQAETGREIDEIATGEGFIIRANHAADRVQIVFDDKPGEAMRAALKSAGWHWSRSEGAWQRKFTPAAIYSAKHLLGVTDAALEQARNIATVQEQPEEYVQTRFF